MFKRWALVVLGAVCGTAVLSVSEIFGTAEPQTTLRIVLKVGTAGP